MPKRDHFSDQLLPAELAGTLAMQLVGERKTSYHAVW